MSRFPDGFPEDGHPGMMPPGMMGGPPGMPGGIPGMPGGPPGPLAIQCNLEGPFVQMIGRWLYMKLVPEDEQKVDVKELGYMQALQELFRHMVPEENRKEELDPIVETMIVTLKKSVANFKKANSSNPMVAEAIISGAFRDTVDGGINFIYDMCNKFAGMELYELKDQDSDDQDEEKGGNGSVIIPE